MEKKLPLEIRPTITSLPKDDKLCDFKVTCPVCDELMLPYTFAPDYKEKPVLATPCSFRSCPKCGSTFQFSKEAQQVVWERAHR